MSRDFKKEHGELRFNIPPNITGKEIQQVRIHPRDNACFFEIEYIYEQPEMKADVDAEKFLGVDLGLDNLATCVTSERASFIIDGKQTKSYNRLYNKENAMHVLTTLCELYGINHVEQEESYTSKASFFDDDELPTYNADNPQSYTFSGTRITRGQYRTSTGYIFNADANGALNILRKSKLVSLMALQDRGCVLRPTASQPRRKVCYASSRPSI